MTCTWEQKPRVWKERQAPSAWVVDYGWDYAAQFFPTWAEAIRYAT